MQTKPRAPQPFTPGQDIEARRQWAGPVVAGVLTAELAEFCESGLSIIVAASTADGMPIGGRAKACRILADGEMKIFMPEPFNAPLVEALRCGSQIAVTFSSPRNHRSIQVKAASARQVAMEDGDLDWVAGQLKRFEADLVGLHFAPRFAAYYTAYHPEEIIAFVLSPRDAFVQTPGPGAGEQLTP